MLFDRKRSDTGSDSLVERWTALVTPSYLIATAVLNASLAASPVALRSVAVPAAVQAIAAGLAAAALAGAVFARRTSTRRGLSLWMSVASGAVMGVGLGRVAPQVPAGTFALTAGLLVISAFVGWRFVAAAAVSLGLGVGGSTLCLAHLPEWPGLSLEVEARYAGVLMSPLWLSTDHAVNVALVSVLIAGLGIAARCQSRGWRSTIRRYAALHRIMRGHRSARDGQDATTALALADSGWALVGVAIVEWETIRVTNVRAPSGEVVWQLVAQALRDAAVPLTDPLNPLARAAREAAPTSLTSCEELSRGMWRHFEAGSRIALGAPAHGRVVPFGTSCRGVVFALSTKWDAAFDWLDDLAGMLTILDGRAAA